MAQIPDKIRLDLKHVKEMEADVVARAPQEACGLIAGREGQAEKVFSIKNVLNSPVRFLMDPQEQWQAFKEIDERAWDLLAIYHSHPAGPAGLSTVDIAESYYPEVAHIVWFKESGGWRYRGYSLQAGKVAEIQIELVSTKDS